MILNEGIVLVGILKKKFIALIVALILCFIGCFSGCTKQITDVDFYEFAKECYATEFYEMCDELYYVKQKGIGENFMVDIENGITEYHCNEEWHLLWPSFTMVKFCQYSRDGYESVKQTITDTWELRELVDGYKINSMDSTVYYVCNTEHQYGEYKDFGFVALCDEKLCVYYFWFYNQDNDYPVTEENEFDEFYKNEFAWFEEK